MDTAHICVSVVRPHVCVHDGTTSSMVPPRTQKGGRMAWVQTWVVSVGASVLLRLFFCECMYKHTKEEPLKSREHL